MTFPNARRLFCLSLLLICCQVIPCSCRERTQPSLSTGHLKMTADTLIDYNRKVVKSEDQEIDDVISRYRWKMLKSPTGLRYMIYQHGNGAVPKENSVVAYSYEVRLINGKICYTSEQSGPKEIKLGHGEIERGLEEGIKLMKVGDRAKFIVPSHLAFGLLGDQDRIPPGATLIYDVRLLKVK